MVSVFLVGSSFSMKKNDPKPVYAFGLSASFMDKDSVVYFTSIQLLDSVYLNEHGFLPQRDLYSYQLKNHLEYNMNKLNYTCIIYFSDNKKKLEKEASKVKKQYEKAKTFVIEGLSQSDFSFKKP